MGILEDEVLQAMAIRDTDPCYCGSRETFAHCCKIQAHLSRIPIDHFDGNENIFLRSGGKFLVGRLRDATDNLDHQCLLCANTAIKSHTVSDSWMRSVFGSDFVCCPTPTDRGGYILKRTPINVASTFRGRCNNHDSNIFQSIDAGLNVTDNCHKNLLAYRSIAREYKVKSDVLKWHYSYFLLRGNGDRNARALQYLIGAYLGMRDLYNLLQFIWIGISISHRYWQGLKHYVFDLGNITPLFVSSCFNPVAKNYDAIILTVYTNPDDKSWCVLSHKYDACKAADFCRGLYKKYRKGISIVDELNKIISQKCENIVCDISRNGDVIDQDDTLNLENCYHSPVYAYIR